MVGVIDMFEQSNLHFSHGGSLTRTFVILNVKTVSVNGVFGGKDYFDNELSDVFVPNGDMIEEDGGGFKRKVKVSDKMNNFLSKSPVFYGIGA
jgi:hypothetical protein